MQIGIKYSKELIGEEMIVKEAGFEVAELPFSLLKEEEAILSRHGIRAKGIALSGATLTSEELKDALDSARRIKAEYIVVSTVGVKDAEELFQVLCTGPSVLREYGIKLYIENGCEEVRKDLFVYNTFSDVAALRKFVERLIKKSEEAADLFGICLNLANAHLLAGNYMSMIEEAGKEIGLLHFNDNDGKYMRNQLPYTFTIGRGAPLMHWYRIIGNLVRVGYEGDIVFQVEGLFQTAPKKLYKAFLGLLYRIGEEWKGQFEFSAKLSEKEKKIILFGAGVMAQNYMDEWGEKYPPAFIADNNKANHGKQKYGATIISPEEILQIPENERYVLICNQYYDEVGAQLSELGISYDCYWDHYYL